MKKFHNFVIKPKFITMALRQNGYTNDTAIADIIDNSLEAEVNASVVKVEFSKIKDEKGKKRIINEIRIIDDGCGMSEERLIEAMALGSDTGKNETTLGMYGAGLKTAALSIGKSLTVLTKTEDGELLKAHLDIDEVDEDGFKVEYSTIDTDDKLHKVFCAETNSTHGTIVIIGKLDKLRNKDVYSFASTLSIDLRLYFNKFIENGYCDMYVNGEKLKFYDTIGIKSGFHTELIDEQTIEVNGVTASIKAWYVPKNPTIEEKKKYDNYLGRGTKTCGLYIYRQRRLVGYGLNLGMISPGARIDHWQNGLRVEIFLDGSSDFVFGTTYTKMITEKSKDQLDQAFSDKLREVIKPYAAAAKAKQKQETPKEDIPQRTIDNMKNVTDALNQNNFLAKGMKTRGKNEKRGNHIEKNPNPKKQENPNPTKIRKEIWFDGFELINDGETGLMYQATITEGKNIIQINRDHIFYKEIFSQLDDDIQIKIAKMLACEIPSKKRCNYWEDDDTQRIIDDYNQLLSDNLRIAFI